MGLKKQKVVDSTLTKHLFDRIYTTRAGRRGFEVPGASDWTVEVFVDGPLTFATVSHPSGTVYTGWSKFNSSDRNYNELNGVCRSITRAVDQFFATRFEKTEEVSTNVTQIRSVANAAVARKELE